MWGVSSSSLKWRPMSGIYKDSGGNNTYDPVQERATSYNWWVYLKRINGKLVFNDYSYSSSTNHHQSECKSLLSQLGIKVDYYIRTRTGLQEFGDKTLQELWERIAELECEMARKGTGGSANARRKREHAELLKQVALCAKLKAKFGASVIKRIRDKAKEEEAARVKAMAEKRAKANEVARQTRALKKSGQVFEINAFVQEF
jgi:polyhydroxyalkanoate synthesis regulator phasin